MMGRELWCEIRNSWLLTAINPVEEETVWNMGGVTKCCHHSDTTESSFCLPHPLYQIAPSSAKPSRRTDGMGIRGGRVEIFCVITFLCPRIFRSVQILLYPPIPTGKQILNWFLYSFLSSVLYPSTLSY